MSAPVQYGAGLMAFAVSLTHDQNLPYQRVAELLNALMGILLSPATLVTWGRQAAARLAAPVAAIGQATALCTTTLTFYAIHATRGAEALSAIGLLAHFRGILVHDHWRASLSAAAEHAFCNAHPLRELIAIAEADPPLAQPPHRAAVRGQRHRQRVMVTPSSLRSRFSSRIFSE